MLPSQSKLESKSKDLFMTVFVHSKSKELTEAFVFRFLKILGDHFPITKNLEKITLKLIRKW